jgi:hypothetical protein
MFKPIQGGVDAVTFDCNRVPQQIRIRSKANGADQAVSDHVVLSVFLLEFGADVTVGGASARRGSSGRRAATYRPAVPPMA